MSGSKNTEFDVVVIGAGAAGMMCAIEAGKRGRKVLLLEKSEKPGKKILISGGGRCNFTNLFAAPENYLSSNKHFCKSAIRSYTQQDFIKLVDKHSVGYHEKKLGQLFCDDGATEITNLLLKECDENGVTLWCDAGAEKVTKAEGGMFYVKLPNSIVEAQSVVLASGGLSIPKIGANDFAYRVARSFDLKLTETFPGLVPFTFEPAELKRFDGLTGVSVDVEAKIGKTVFRENALFTHRGISGPAILQISSFWTEGQGVQIDFLPGVDLFEELKNLRSENPRGSISKYLSRHLANRLVDKLLEPFGNLQEIGNCSDKLLRIIADQVNRTTIYPNGTEGYRKAEVTVGGVDTSELSSKTMEVKSVPGLFFIGEAVDVTGHLGGYNFQWAWSSGYAAGQYA